MLHDFLLIYVITTYNSVENSSSIRGFVERRQFSLSVVPVLVLSMEVAEVLGWGAGAEVEPLLLM